MAALMREVWRDRFGCQLLLLFDFVHLGNEDNTSWILICYRNVTVHIM